jgi:hypothetical protein
VDYRMVLDDERKRKEKKRKENKRKKIRAATNTSAYMLPPIITHLRCEVLVDDL